MGEITDALRANLRELAQSDARLLRELDAAIPGAPGGQSGVAAANSAPQLDDGLERLSLKDLRELCKQRRLKGITRLKKDDLIALLRGGSPAAPAALPAGRRAPTTAAATTAAATTAASTTAASAEPPAVAPELEARLARMEALLQRIAAHLGVS